MRDWKSWYGVFAQDEDERYDAEDHEVLAYGAPFLSYLVRWGFGKTKSFLHWKWWGVQVET